LRSDAEVYPGRVQDRDQARLRTLLLTRACDRAELSLLKQGKAWLHVSSEGHEALAVLAEHLEPQDLLFPYYRDRPLLLARGVTPAQLAREQMATADSASAGRQMPLHGSYRSLGIFPAVTPTAAQCLPAVGAAWGLQRQGARTLVLCTLGDAATRQGEFYEALCFAVEHRLPVVFVIEDNGYGISTPTANQLPLRLGVLALDRCTRVDGRDPDAIASAAAAAYAKARDGEGPQLLWCELDRLGSHTNSDDQAVYRPAPDLAAASARDPISRYTDHLLVAGHLTPDSLAALTSQIDAEVSAAFADAEQSIRLAHPPAVPSDLLAPVERVAVLPPALRESAPTLVAALNSVLDAALASTPRTLVFGEDVEDPKGGVFGFTKGLSSRYPGRVVNSPLAEATIIGTAVGLAATGQRPVFELQFVDFLAPGFNQLLTQAATLRWRSRGEWTCPAVFYAPYGAYVPAGGPWHSQSNEGLWCHIPGLRVAVPSRPADLVGLFWTALHADDPSLVLIPKHLMRLRVATEAVTTLPWGRARVARPGSDVTVLTWGNGVPLALAAAEQLARECATEVLDLRSLVPCDWQAIGLSVQRTGRLVIVTEESRTGSFGQALLGEVMSRAVLFQTLQAAPALVARPDSHVPYYPDAEAQLLPSTNDVVAAIRQVLN
jgi:2-oxoisovalerate dehydrogenase E1 component